MTVLSQCVACVHFKPQYRGDDRCDAFPQGIQAAIRWNEIDHRQPVEGDGGIQFEQYPDGVLRFLDVELPDPPKE